MPPKTLRREKAAASAGMAAAAAARPPRHARHAAPPTPALAAVAEHVRRDITLKTEDLAPLFASDSR